MHGREEWILVYMVLNISAQNGPFGPRFQTIFPFLVTMIVLTIRGSVTSVPNSLIFWKMAHRKRHVLNANVKAKRSFFCTEHKDSRSYIHLPKRTSNSRSICSR